MATPERHEKIYELFVNARKLDDAALAVYLDKACADDPSLREEVEALLAQDSEMTSFLEQPPAVLSANSIRDRCSVSAVSVWRTGTKDGLGEAIQWTRVRINTGVWTRTRTHSPLAAPANSDLTCLRPRGNTGDADRRLAE